MLCNWATGAGTLEWALRLLFGHRQCLDLVLDRVLYREELAHEFWQYLAARGHAASFASSQYTPRLPRVLRPVPWLSESEVAYLRLARQEEVSPAEGMGLCRKHQRLMQLAFRNAAFFSFGALDSQLHSEYRFEVLPDYQYGILVLYHLHFLKISSRRVNDIVRQLAYLKFELADYICCLSKCICSSSKHLETSCLK